MNVISTGMSFRPKGEIFLPARRFLAALGMTSAPVISTEGRNLPARAKIPRCARNDHCACHFDRREKSSCLREDSLLRSE
jgi:hypothetical protein